MASRGLDSQRGRFIELRRAYVLGGPGGVFVRVIVRPGLWSNLYHRQRLTAHDAHRNLTADDFLLHQDRPTVSHSLGQGAWPSEGAVHKFQPDARALSHRLEHQRQRQAKRQLRTILLDHHIVGRGKAERCAHPLGLNLVKSQSAHLGTASGVRCAKRVQFGLHRAVLSVGTVQREEDHVHVER